MVYIHFDGLLFGLERNVLYWCTCIHPEKSACHDKTMVSKHGINLFQDKLLDIVDDAGDTACV